MSFLKGLEPNIRGKDLDNPQADTPQPQANQQATGEATAPRGIPTPPPAAPQVDENTSMGPSVSPADLQAAFDVQNPEQREYKSLAEARDGIAQEMGQEKATPFGEYQRRIKGFIDEHDNARSSIKGKGKQVQLNFRISETSRHFLKLVALENHVDVTTYVFGAINARLHAEGRTRFVR
ncbi:hypothetical protein [Hirschia maritima]|uniref:hypothetical protein n=1 Tax=Hirschia maritima TaxID=1121961 RepID=UPI00037D9498|nr:hypothetical protein [Hirschia maritima]